MIIPASYKPPFSVAAKPQAKLVPTVRFGDTTLKDMTVIKNKRSPLHYFNLNRFSQTLQQQKLIVLPEKKRKKYPPSNPNWKFALGKKLFALFAIIGSAKVVRGETWAPNVNILAPIPQNEESTNSLTSISPEDFAKQNKEIYPGSGSRYLEALMKIMKQPDIHCLGEAQNRLQEKGFYDPRENRLRYPLTRSEDILKVWCTDGNPQHKFVLMMGGNKGQWPGDVAPREVLAKINFLHLQDMLDNKFPGIPKENIIMRYTDPVTTENGSTIGLFEKNLDWLAKKIKGGNIQKPELLVYYTGHGVALETYNGDLRPSVEGAHQGVLARDITKVSGLHEDTVKKLFKAFPKDTKITFIPDTCHSGAWLF